MRTRTRYPITRSVAALAAVLALAGCSFRSGTTESDSGWHTKADRALGSAVSSVGTAELLLKSSRDGRLTHPYVVVAIRDTVTDLDKENQAFLSVQPPEKLRKQNDTAVQALEGAVQLLNRAVVAVTGSDSSLRDSVLKELQKAHGDLSDLQSTIDESAR